MYKSLLYTLQAVAAGKQRIRAEQWRQVQLLRAVVHAWQGHTWYKLDCQRLKRKAIRHRSIAPAPVLRPHRAHTPSPLLPPAPPSPHDAPSPLPPASCLPPRCHTLRLMFPCFASVLHSLCDVCLVVCMPEHQQTFLAIF